MDPNSDLSDFYDVVVLGTSLTEAIVAAALARNGKKVLHLEKSSTYGSTSGTYNVGEFFAILEAQQNLKPQPDKIASLGADLAALKEINVVNGATPFLTDVVIGEVTDGMHGSANYFHGAIARKFNVDLTPKLFWASSQPIDLLIKSGVSRYLEFRSLQHVYLFLDNKLNQVPASKSDIFKNKSISLKEKRQLTKFLSILTEPNDEDKQALQAFQEKLFVEFLENRGLSKNLQLYILYSIAMIETDQFDEINTHRKLTPEGMALLKRFITSLSRYGNSPFLAPLYGSGEIAQAFCRLAAVYGAVYVLKRGVSKVLFENGKVSGIETEGKKVKCSFLVSNPEHLSNFVTVSQTSLSRAIIVTNKSLGEDDDGNLLGTVPPNAIGNKKPVSIVQSDDALATCPDGTYLVHITSESTTPAKTDFASLFDILFAKPEDEESPKPRNIWSCLYNQRAREPLVSLKPIDNLVIPPETDFNLAFDAAFRKAEEIFHRFYPDEEFIPLVPNPEDVVFEPENAEKAEAQDDEKGTAVDG